MAAEFGTAPHTWALVSGDLPDGLELADGGMLAGEPLEVGVSTFTVEVTDSSGATRQKAYRKRIGLGVTPGDVLINKAGITPVPGRIYPYYILLRNRTDRTLYDVRVFELLEGWFEFIGSSPPPTVLEPRPTGNVHWTIPQLAPGELFVITYWVRLPDEFPLGFVVTGEACMDDDDCNRERAECVREGKERCEDCCCGWHFPVGSCTQCGTMENEQCRQEWLTCKQRIGQGTSEVLPEGGSGGGCWPRPDPTGGAVDPNEKSVGAGPVVPPGEVLGYTIHFENIGDVEARDVFLTDVLDADLDLSTVQVLRPLGGLVALAPDTTVSIFDDDDEVWNVTLDSATRTLTWELLNTDLPPDEGDSVFFVVQAPEGLPSGTEIRNDSTIQFEVFEPLTTNETLNTIDATPPVTTVEPLPERTFTEEFEIAWSGFDPIGEIEIFAIYVSRNGGTFLRHAMRHVSEPRSLLFEGEYGSTYSFLCIARDTAGNAEALDGIAEATTTVERPPRPTFHRGDPNTSGTTDISDGVTVFGHLFVGSPATIPCRESADTNNDGAVDISDGIYLLNWLFAGGADLVAPGSADEPCGEDPDASGSPGDLGCDDYPPCE